MAQTVVQTVSCRTCNEEKLQDCIFEKDFTHLKDYIRFIVTGSLSVVTVLIACLTTLTRSIRYFAWFLFAFTSMVFLMLIITGIVDAVNPQLLKDT